MEEESTKTKKTDQSKLEANVLVFLFIRDAIHAMRFLDSQGISFKIHKAHEGYWLNVHWKNGNICGLTYQEYDQIEQILNQRKKDHEQSKNC